MRILLCEDDAGIIKKLTLTLAQEGYDVIAVNRQRDALEAAENESYDLALLDLTFPDGSGYPICSAIKRKGDIPVIFLTAADDEFNVVTGFDVGADDYITKPFRPLELVSRIKNALRRYGKSQSIFNIGSLRVDTISGAVTRDGEEVILSALEYRLLLMFINNRGAVLTREQLMGKIWDMAGNYANDNALTVCIKRLRDKIEDDPQDPKIIQTVRGMGYRMIK
ncbi:MAG: response regulator transcription factor [Candidatus Gastranaerophilaceae bacterium]|jgi:DNA-binding response OmpR family regulator|nr:response regulator transcription factor [Christensenellales bacterium]